MDGRDGIAFRIVATLAIFIIHHLDVAEGNIRCRNVKCPLQLWLDGLKTVYCNTIVWVQSLQDATGKQVFLKGTDPHIGILALEGIAELADTCRGVEYRSHLHTRVLHHLGDCTDDRRRGVESGIHRPLDAVRQFLGLLVVTGTLTDGIKQFLGLIIILPVRLVPELYVAIVDVIDIHIVQHELQTAKTAVSLQDFTLRIRRRPTLFLELEDGTDSGNVIL